MKISFIVLFMTPKRTEPDNTFAWIAIHMQGSSGNFFFTFQGSSFGTRRSVPGSYICHFSLGVAFDLEVGRKVVFLWWCSPEFRGGVQNCRRQQLIVELKVTNSKKSSQECKTALTSQFWSVMGSVMGLVMVSVMREVPTSQEISWTVGSSEFLNGHHPPTTDRPSVWYRTARATNNKKESIFVCSKFLLKVTFTPYLKVTLKRRC